MEVTKYMDSKNLKILIEELADSISDLSFYDYPKTIAKYKKEEGGK